MSGIVDIVYDDGKYHDRIEVAGEFTNWQGVPLGLDSGTAYAAVFDGAEPGKCYQYKFIVDGHWTLHPSLPTIQDAAGFVNHPAVAESTNQYDQKSANTETPSSPSRSSAAGNTASTTAAAGGIGAVGVAGAGIAGAGAGAGAASAGSTDPSRVPGAQVASAQERAIEQEELRDTLGNAPGASYGNVTGAGLGAGVYTTQGQSLPNSSSTAGVHSGLRSLSENNTGLYGSSKGPTELNAQTSAAPEPYELKNSQLEKPYERVDGLDQFASQHNQSQHNQNLQSEPAPEPYEYKGTQLEKPVEKVSGLDQVNTATSELGTSEPYEVIGSDLDKPTEKVSGLEHFVTGVPLNLSSQSTDPYELRGSDLSKPVEKVDGLDEVNTATSATTGTRGAGNFQESFVAVSHKPQTQSSGYEYKEKDLTQPKESTGGEAEPFAYSGIPGSLPFEQRVAGNVSPEQVTDSTVSALGGESKDESLSRSESSRLANESLGESNYLDAESSIKRGVNPDESLESSFDGRYESATEEGFGDELRTGPATVLGKPLETTTTTTAAGATATSAGVPPSASDRTISKYVVEETRSSSLDRAAAERAVKDAEPVPEPLQPTHFKTSDGSEGVVIPSNVDEEELGSELPSRTTSSTSSPKKHVPIDVSTGFPVDEPEQQQLHSQKSSASSRSQYRSIGGIPTGRHEEKRPLSYSGLPATGVSAPVNTHENRNAAVIAAAAKASAFAKQDVAAISNPQQYHSQQSSPRPTREKSRRPLSTSFGHAKKPSSTSASSSPGVPRPEVPSSTGVGSSGLPNRGLASGATETSGIDAGGLGAGGLAAGGAGAGGAGSGLASTGHYTSGLNASGLSKGAAGARGELGGAQSSFERERQGISQLERTGSKRESKVKSFFRKLGSK